MIDYDSSGPVATSLPYRQDGPNTPAYTQPQAAMQSYTRSSSAQTPAQPSSASHRHSRTVSSNTLPYVVANASAYSHIPAQEPTSGADRRTSSATFSTSNSTRVDSMHRQPTTGSTTSAPRRSTSSRSSTNTPTSYVALMRKQKATVWCDRAQNIDPRIAAAQRAAKHRAILEVHGGSAGSGRTSTITGGGVVGKIRHGGVPKSAGYAPANLSGAGVPVRLSANEMLGDEDEGRSLGDNASSMAHARTGSGRSSTNSAKYRSGYPRPDQGRVSTTSTPPSGGESSSNDIPEEEHRDQPRRPPSKQDYFDNNVPEKSSGSSLEREDSFGEVNDMKAPIAKNKALDQVKTAEDLRRRGSVDERAMSIGATVRLFVANPDLDE